MSVVATGDLPRNAGLEPTSHPASARGSNLEISGHVAQVNLLLTCATLLLLIAVGQWLIALLSGSVAAQLPEQEEPLPGESGQLPAEQPISETVSPTTILEMFFSAGEGLGLAKSGGLAQDDPEALATNEAIDLAGPVFSLNLAGSDKYFLPYSSKGLEGLIYSWNPAGGTYSMDWGDVDRDGNLDLVTGAVGSVSMHKNDDGHFFRVWSEARRALGVRWFQPSDSPLQEALDFSLVGESTDGQPDSPGTMIVYLQPGTSSLPVETYSVPAQLLRAEPRDFDGDSGMDLVVSTNALDPPSGCPVLLFRRQSDGLPYGAQPECVSDQATASLAAADADGDGDPDLALALHRSKEICVVINNGGVLTVTNSLLVDGSLAHIPYDLAWGDYDGDGQIDLAAAFPLEQQVRIYHSHGVAVTFTLAYSLTTAALMTPLAIDWADLDNDGQLELIVGDLPPTAVTYDRESGSFSTSALTLIPIRSGRIQEIRAIDVDNDADLDVSIANQYGTSQLYPNTGSVLGGSLQRFAGPAQGIAWGDYTGDGRLDLALATATGVRLYESQGATLVGDEFLDTGPARGLAWAAYNVGDGRLDLAVAGTGGAAVYLNQGSGLDTIPDWSDAAAPASAVAWADFDSDGRLDLAVGGGQGIRVYRHDGTSLTASPVFTVTSIEAWDLAWADYDGDFYPDLAVASSQGVQVYHNQIGVLAPLWNLPLGGDARSVAWADHDGDGWLELTAGQYGPANLIYENQNGVLSTSPAYVGGPNASGKTTQVAWGDWDNDGDPDLAVANDDGKDLIYANTGSALVLDPALGFGWESTVLADTTSLAWGDMDGDGDLDLAVTADGGSGWYANNYVLPAQLGRQYAPLPQNPPVLSIARPGITDDAYFSSSAEVLGSPTDNGLVPCQFYYYDPEGDPWTGMSFQFSLDGGGTWQATQNITIAPIAGGQYSGEWDARADRAVSDSARLRISLIHGTPSGPVQKAQTGTTSPPFRVRGTDCIWPSGPAITKLSPVEDPVVGQLVTFLGMVDEGSGQLTFAWDFDDGNTTEGQQVSHRYQEAQTYNVKLTIEANPTGGEFCPTRPVMARMAITVLPSTVAPGMLGQGHAYLYLPLVVAKAPPAATPVLTETEQ